MISIIICTYNRCDSLKGTLESLLAMEGRDAIDHEIIIVDNNSIDLTKEVVAAHTAQFQGRLRYLFEGQQGKSFALNSGIKNAKGAILAFTDDDVIVDPHYLKEITKALNETHKNIGFIGGRIYPKWPGERPDWISGSLLGALALLDYGPVPFVLDASNDPLTLKSRIFFGANFACRKSLFEKFGSYDVNKMVAEDTEICLRFYANGAKGLYVPSLIVHHKIPITRNNPDYFFRWYYHQGQFQNIVDNPRPKFFQPWGIPFWFLGQTAQFYVKSVLSEDFHHKVIYRCWALFNCGQMKKLIKEKRR